MRTLARSTLLLVGLVLTFSATSAPRAQSRGNGGSLESAVPMVDGCTLSTTDVTFGIVMGTAGSIRAAGAVDVQCTPDLDFAISIDRGLYAIGNGRRMRNPATGDTMAYELYSDAGHTRRWAHQRPRRVLGNSGATGLVTYPVYGELRFDGMADPGRYEDTVTVTIEF